jgi:hypothetical protein
VFSLERELRPTVIELNRLPVILVMTALTASRFHDLVHFPVVRVLVTRLALDRSEFEIESDLLVFAFEQMARRAGHRAMRSSKRIAGLIVFGHLEAGRAETLYGMALVARALRLTRRKFTPVVVGVAVGALRELDSRFRAAGDVALAAGDRRVKSSEGITRSVVIEGGAVGDVPTRFIVATRARRSKLSLVHVGVAVGATGVRNRFE